MIDIAPRRGRHSRRDKIDANSRLGLYCVEFLNAGDTFVAWVCDNAETAHGGEVQQALFGRSEIGRGAHAAGMGARAEKINKAAFAFSKGAASRFHLRNRRYIGNKHKLLGWIFSIVDKACDGDSLLDIFAGTGVVAAAAAARFDKIIVNDFLFSNETIYRAFFGGGEWDAEKTAAIIRGYNDTAAVAADLPDNYFSVNFGGRYFSRDSAKAIGAIREDIERRRQNLTAREYNTLIASLLYSVDKIANTVGHYDAYRKKQSVEDRFIMRPIAPVAMKNVAIFRQDANHLAKRARADIVYIDPPYNSRQYSRFYHILETLTKWDKPRLHGVALKPRAENMSDYCRVSAAAKFAELAKDIQARYIVVSYNNTYAPKSNSSKNRITLAEINAILARRGEVRVYEKDYRHFNAGNTDFDNHKEYLFVTKVAR